MPKGLKILLIALGGIAVTGTVVGVIYTRAKRKRGEEEFKEELDTAIQYNKCLKTAYDRKQKIKCRNQSIPNELYPTAADKNNRRLELRALLQEAGIKPLYV